MLAFNVLTESRVETKLEFKSEHKFELKQLNSLFFNKKPPLTFSAAMADEVSRP